MGAYLTKPKIEKTTEVHKANDLRIGLCEMQGWRSNMEDAHIAYFNMEKLPKASLLGVFDGHGGSFIAEQIKRDDEGFYSDVMKTPAFSAGGNATELGASLREAFLAFDSRLKPISASTVDRSGATGTTALITETHIICANAGDSRTVLGRAGKAIPLSVDHKPDDEVEKLRIEAAGGSVMMNRVNGDLAVSRALGDFTYKANDDVADIAQMVSPEPDIRIEGRTSDDQVLVLACDGVWDVMTNEEVITYILENHMKYPDMSMLGAAMLDECLARNSRDNMTICICMFPGMGEPTEEEKVKMYAELKLAEEKRVAEEKAEEAAEAARLQEYDK